MLMTTTSAYVSTVKANRTIELPEDIPVGVKVAVIVLPPEEIEEEDTVRNRHFQRVMNAIRIAMNSNFIPPDISNQELNQLIDEARQTAKA